MPSLGCAEPGSVLSDNGVAKNADGGTKTSTESAGTSASAPTQLRAQLAQNVANPNLSYQDQLQMIRPDLPLGFQYADSGVESGHSTAGPPSAPGSPAAAVQLKAGRSSAPVQKVDAPAAEEKPSEKYKNELKTVPAAVRPWAKKKIDQKAKVVKTKANWNEVRTWLAGQIPGTQLKGAKWSKIEKTWWFKYMESVSTVKRTIKGSDQLIGLREFLLGASVEIVPLMKAAATQYDASLEVITTAKDPNEPKWKDAKEGAWLGTEFGWKYPKTAQKMMKAGGYAQAKKGDKFKKQDHHIWPNWAGGVNYISKPTSPNSDVAPAEAEVTVKAAHWHRLTRQAPAGEKKKVTWPSLKNEIGQDIAGTSVKEDGDSKYPSSGVVTMHTPYHVPRNGVGIESAHKGADQALQGALGVGSSSYKKAGGKLIDVAVDAAKTAKESGKEVPVGKRHRLPASMANSLAGYYKRWSKDQNEKIPESKIQAAINAGMSSASEMVDNAYNRALQKGPTNTEELRDGETAEKIFYDFNYNPKFKVEIPYAKKDISAKTATPGITHPGATFGELKVVYGDGGSIASGHLFTKLDAAGAISTPKAQKAEITPKGSKGGQVKNEFAGIKPGKGLPSFLKGLKITGALIDNGVEATCTFTPGVSGIKGLGIKQSQFKIKVVNGVVSGSASLDLSNASGTVSGSVAVSYKAGKGFVFSGTGKLKLGSTLPDLNLTFEHKGGKTVINGTQQVAASPDGFIKSGTIHAGYHSKKGITVGGTIKTGKVAGGLIGPATTTVQYSSKTGHITATAKGIAVKDPARKLNARVTKITANLSTGEVSGSGKLTSLEAGVGSYKVKLKSNKIGFSKAPGGPIQVTAKSISGTLVDAAGKKLATGTCTNGTFGEGGFSGDLGVKMAGKMSKQFGAAKVDVNKAALNLKVVNNSLKEVSLADAACDLTVGTLKLKGTLAGKFDLKTGNFNNVTATLKLGTGNKKPHIERNGVKINFGSATGFTAKLNANTLQSFAFNLSYTASIGDTDPIKVGGTINGTYKAGQWNFGASAILKAKAQFGTKFKAVVAKGASFKLGMKGGNISVDFKGLKFTVKKGKFKLDGTVKTASYAGGKFNLDATLAVSGPAVIKKGKFSASLTGGSMDLSVTNSAIDSLALKGLTGNLTYGDLSVNLGIESGTYDGSAFTGTATASLTKSLTIGQGPKVVFGKGTGLAVSMADNKVTTVSGQMNGAVYNGAEEKVLSGNATGTYDAANNEFSGTGDMTLEKSFTLGRLEVAKTTVKAVITKNKFTAITGAFTAYILDKDQKRFLDVSLTVTKGDMTSDPPLFSGSAKVKTVRDMTVTIGSQQITFGGGTGVDVQVVDNEIKRIEVDANLKNDIEPFGSNKLTVHKGVSVKLVVLDGALQEASVNDIKFTIHALKHDKPGEIKKLGVVNKGGTYGLVFSGGSIENFKLGNVKGSLTGLHYLSPTNFGGVGEASVTLFRGIGIKASLDFKNRLTPLVTIGGSIDIPILPSKWFFDKGMKGDALDNSWKLLNAGVKANVKGVDIIANLSLYAGFGVGTDAVGVSGTLVGIQPFDPSTDTIPDVDIANVTLKGGAKTKGGLSAVAKVSVGKKGVAELGSKGDATVTGALSAKMDVTPRLFFKGGRFGGDFKAGFSVEGSYSADFTNSLFFSLLKNSWDLGKLYDKTIDLGELFKWKWNADWSFNDTGEEASAPPVTNAQVPETVVSEADSAPAYTEGQPAAAGMEGADGAPAPSPGGGALKKLEEKGETINLVSAVVGAVIPLSSMIASLLPPSVASLGAVGDFVETANKCVDLVDAIDKASKTGLLEKLSNEYEDMKLAIDMLKGYANLINQLSGKSIDDWLAESEGVAKFTEDCSYKMAKCSEAAYFWKKRKRTPPYSQAVCDKWAKSWAGTKRAHTWNIDNYIDRKQAETFGDVYGQMSSSDWKRRLNKLKGDWEVEGKQIWDHYFPSGLRK